MNGLPRAWTKASRWIAADALDDAYNGISDPNSRPNLYFICSLNSGLVEAAGDDIARCCHRDGILASSYFFRKSIPRNNGKSLVATLAYRLCFTIPFIRSGILGAVYADPDILDHFVNLEAQLIELILGPLEENKERLAQDGVRVILIPFIIALPRTLSRQLSYLPYTI
jgi:hypothetical protein